MQNVTIKAIPKQVVVAFSESIFEFVVLIEIKALLSRGHAQHIHHPLIDYVIVLDVSGSTQIIDNG